MVTVSFRYFTYMWKKWKIAVLILGYILFSLYLSLSIGLFELPDGFLYFNIANFLLYGHYYSIAPFNNAIPDVSHPPIYGIFLILTSLRPQIGMIVTSFVQLLMVGLSGVFVYLTTKQLQKKIAVWALIIFFVTPFTIIYATTNMAEVFTIFLVALYMYAVTAVFTKKFSLPATSLVLLTCFMTLTKYVFLYFVPFSLLLALFVEFHDRKTHIGVRLLRWIPSLIGFLAVFWWMSFVHSYYGRWNTNVMSGRQLYAGAIYNAKINLNKESTAYQKFLDFSGLVEIPNIPVVDVQQSFRYAFNQNLITEVAMDDIFHDLAIDAIKREPLTFFLSTLSGIVSNVTAPPYHGCLIQSLGFPDPTCPSSVDMNCRIPWFCSVLGCSEADWGSMCKPVIQNRVQNNLWITLIRLNELSYPSGMIVLLIFSLIGGIALILRWKTIGIVLVLHWLFLLGIHGMLARGEGRYTMITYPFMALFAAFGLQSVIRGIKKLTVRSESR